MSLDAVLSIASGGLANVNRQLALVSQNVGNASTPGYTREVGQQTAVSVDGVGMGVRTGAAARSVDTLMQDALWQQNAGVAALQVRSDALAAIDAAHGTPGQGDDLSSLTGALSDAFTTLSSDPSAAAAQGQVVAAASALASGVNRVADACCTQRQAAQDALVQDVTDLNNALGQVGTLSDQIMRVSAQGDSTADLEDQRDTAMQTVCDLTGAQALRQPNGDMQIFTRSGIVLPTRPAGTPLQTSDVTTAPALAGAPVLLQGVDVTARLTGGKIGAELALRDTELPTAQAELDEFAHDLASRFDAVGLQLFADRGSAVAAAATTSPVQASYVGLANRLQVNPAVAANPTLVRDGTTGTASGQASDGSLIARVLNETFGTVGQSGTAPPSVSGLGISGTLSARFASPSSLSAFASTVASVQTGASADSATQLAQAQSTQGVLSAKVAAVSGVSIDTEMSTMIGLQNAYAANARIVSTMQQMWTQLLGMVGG
jgi:flagellar hook-associated protein 1 FlgK